MSLLKRLRNQEIEVEVVETGETKPLGEVKPLVPHYAKKWNHGDIEIRLHNYIVDELKRKEISDLDALISSLTEDFFVTETTPLTAEEKQEVLRRVKHELTGYGPITPLLEDPTVTEVMVNSPHDVYVERRGRISKVPITFRDDEHITRVIEKIVTPLGRRIDESSPMVDARLPDGSRVNAIIPPIAVNGPILTVRKFSKKPFMIYDLIRLETLNETMARFIEACVKARLNIFVSGGTGSGKTTLLNVISSFIPADERIITIEDAMELRLSQDHVISLEARPANIEGGGEIRIRDLVRNSLRMRPDRIVVGEVRGAEALDMLQAMNTGHDGSLSTGHANSPRDLLARLETMVLMAGYDLPVRAIREQVAGAIDLIIHQSRMRDGMRRITHITEVIGMEGDVIVLQDLFTFREMGIGQDGNIRGEFVPTGILPHFIEKLELAGLTIPHSWFDEGRRL